MARCFIFYGFVNVLFLFSLTWITVYGEIPGPYPMDYVDYIIIGVTCTAFVGIAIGIVIVLIKKRMDEKKHARVGTTNLSVHENTAYQATEDS
jgi:hypothetical protein